MSTTAARRARETSLAMSARSTAAVDRRSSQKDDRRRIEAGEIAREGARRLDARTVAAVHVERQADDQREGVEFADVRAQRLGVLARSASRFDRDERRRDAPLDVGERESDRLGSEIDADQPRLGGQALGERFERERASATSPRALARRARAAKGRIAAPARVATPKRAML